MLEERGKNARTREENVTRNIVFFYSYLIELKFINQGLDLLNISNIFRDHRVTSKIPQISRILTLLSFVISTKKLLEISFSTATKSLLILIFGVLFNHLALVRTRHFCIHLQVMLSQATLPVSPTRDYGNFLRRGLNTDFHPGLILLNAVVFSRKHFRHIASDGVRRKVSKCIPLTTGIMNFYELLTLGQNNVMPAGNAYPSGHLVPSPILGLANAPIVETKFLELAMSLLDFSPQIPLGTFSILLTQTTAYSFSEGTEKGDGEITQSMYVFAPADKAANNVIII